MTGAGGGARSGRASSAAFALDGAVVRLGGRPALRGVDLAVRPGETLPLLGPSGSGKSTLVRAILGLVALDAGRVLLRGRVATEGRRLRLPPEARGLGVVFQDLALWPHLTVAGHLRFVLRARGLPRSEEADRIAATLAQVGIADLAGRRPGELSGGERQRVALARALVADPDIVLFDEPTASLDVHLRGEVLALVAELLGRRGAAALWVTHDPREALILGERIAVMEAGRIVQQGAAAELRADPATPFVRAALGAGGPPAGAPG